MAEFLLKDRGSIQKLMRKILWHNYFSDFITVEITERNKSVISGASGKNRADAPLDKITNQGTGQNRHVIKN